MFEICNSETETAGKIESSDGRLTEGGSCMYGPSYWCSSWERAEECGVSSILFTLLQLLLFYPSIYKRNLMFSNGCMHSIKSTYRIRIAYVCGLFHLL